MADLGPLVCCWWWGRSQRPGEMRLLDTGAPRAVRRGQPSLLSAVPVRERASPPSPGARRPSRPHPPHQGRGPASHSQGWRLYPRHREPLSVSETALSAWTAVPGGGPRGTVYEATATLRLQGPCPRLHPEPSRRERGSPGNPGASGACVSVVRFCRRAGRHRQSLAAVLGLSPVSERGRPAAARSPAQNGGGTCCCA